MVRSIAANADLPLAWDDPSTRLAIEKYMQSVRPDAPWCPSNIEFIRRINGLADEEAAGHHQASGRAPRHVSAGRGGGGAPPPAGAGGK